MTNEPPKGLRANLVKSYVSDPITDDNFYDTCHKPFEFHKLLFGLCFFHAVIQERRNFGPLGWNIPYEFNDSDLLISMQQLRMFLNEYNAIPFKAIKYLAGQANYGGRVTDEMDRRTLVSLLSTYYTPDIFENKYRFSPSGIYYAPNGKREDILDYIKSLPMNQEPEVFGLHQNADITKALKETNQLLNSLQLTTTHTGGAEGKSQELVDSIAGSILERLPEEFDIAEIQERYPVVYEESMNTVLVQELIRYNKLLRVVRKSLVDVRKALKGQVLMSSDLEKLSISIMNSQIPDKWMENSYPSLKPLSGYINDLIARIQFFQDWVENGPPAVFWVSGFFFTQSFLTGVMQNYARRHTIPIDTLAFDFKVMEKEPTRPPESGCYIKGMFLEGARWNYTKGTLDECEPKVLFSPAPVLWLKPVEISKAVYPPHYSCPLYKTSARRGTLSTTGHSTNFILHVRLPAVDSDHWVQRGTALVCQLDE